jgi:hypothetical protein
MSTIVNYIINDYIIDDIMNDIKLNGELYNKKPRYFDKDSDFALEDEVISQLNVQSVSEDISLQKLKIS